VNNGEAESRKVEAQFKSIEKMKSNFLNFGLILALVFTTTVFNSCRKDDNDGGDKAFKITATNVTVHGGAEVKIVKALAYWDDGSDYGRDVIAQTPFANKGFTVEFPATVDAKYSNLDLGEAPSGVSVSDKNATIFYVDNISGYNADDEEIGSFYLLAEEDDDMYRTAWWYADRDVTIKGESGGANYDITLKKGWNVVYMSDVDGDDSWTSKKPTGVSYTWHFYMLV